MTHIVLEALAQKSNLSAGFCSNLSESAVICLTSQAHISGVSLKVTTSEDELYAPVSWHTDVTESLLRTFRDEKRTTDDGAMCISLFLALNLTEYPDVEASATGNGIDFWLCHEGELNFAARLEISGIRRESAGNTVEKRLAEKEISIKKSDATLLPAYISIVEFSQPKAIFVKK